MKNGGYLVRLSQQALVDCSWGYEISLFYASRYFDWQLRVDIYIIPFCELLYSLKLIRSFGNNGCDGGEDFRAYQWILKHGGIPTEEDYGPYLGEVRNYRNFIDQLSNYL